MLTTMLRNYDRLQRGLDRLQPVLLLAVRLYWGWQFFLAGRGKLLNIERTAGFFESIDIPLPLANAYAAGITECFGGLLLLVGLASRIASLPLLFTMSIAYVTAHREQLLSAFSNSDAFVTAPPFLFLLASLVVLVFGPGPLSLDRLIAQFRVRRSVTANDAPVPSTLARAVAR